MTARPYALGEKGLSTGEGAYGNGSGGQDMRRDFRYGHPSES